MLVVGQRGRRLWHGKENRIAAPGGGQYDRRTHDPLNRHAAFALPQLDEDGRADGNLKMG